MLERLGRCNQLIWSTAADVLAAGTSVVLDVGAMRRADRELIRQIAEEKGLSPQWHFVDAPQEVRRARVAGRNAAKGETFVMEVTPEMFERLEAIYEPPAPAELEGAVLSVNDEVGIAAPTLSSRPLQIIAARDDLRNWWDLAPRLARRSQPRR